LSILFYNSEVSYKENQCFIIKKPCNILTFLYFLESYC